MRYRGGCRNRYWTSGSRSTPSTPTGSRARPGWPGASTSSCRPVSSRSRTCCPANGPSHGSRSRWRRRTATAAPTCWPRNWPRWTAPWPGCTGSRCPRWSPPSAIPVPTVPESAPEFVRTVTAEMMAGRGNLLPVSALPVDGTYPSGTTAYEKRNISELVAVWDSDSCIQCGNCGFVCPHSVIRSKFYDESQLAGAPEEFDSAPLDAVGLPERPVLVAGVRRGLHRVRLVRRGLPGRHPRPDRHQGDQPRSRRAAGGHRAGEHRVSSSPCRPMTGPGGLRHRAWNPVPGPAFRVLRRVRGMR